MRKIIVKPTRVQYICPQLFDVNVFGSLTGICMTVIFESGSLLHPARDSFLYENEALRTFPDLELRIYPKFFTNFLAASH